MPDLLCGSVAYSTSLSAFALGKLQRLQNRAIRAVFSLPPTSSVSHQRESIFFFFFFLLRSHNQLEKNKERQWYGD